MGFTFILLYFLIVTFVIEISVILFNLTGLETQVSRYQVISMLTGTGFTTDESQLIIDHPVRRRLSAFLILFGAFSLAVIISAITNILANDLRLKELTAINLVLLILFLIGKTPPIRRVLHKKFNKEMEKNLEVSELPIKDALYIEKDDLVTIVTIMEDSPLIGKKINDLIGKTDDLNILFVKRGDIRIRRELSGESVKEGDELLIYGKEGHIRKRFSSEKGIKEKGSSS
ncbi:TrkA C-terminal domain-containing protein [Bacillus xiapuensis]|uniref:TrkA C-terminal domain-containing protein n=1 Tax=Bacillus xiapuensis TaxID=2014075 RepID=UPI000C240984|nr:TrkA C-terminal domain-containing protein [Bacillus xiapuensis]